MGLGSKLKMQKDKVVKEALTSFKESANVIMVDDTQNEVLKGNRYEGKEIKKGDIIAFVKSELCKIAPLYIPIINREFEVCEQKFTINTDGVSIKVGEYFFENNLDEVIIETLQLVVGIALGHHYMRGISANYFNADSKRILKYAIATANKKIRNTIIRSFPHNIGLYSYSLDKLDVEAKKQVLKNGVENIDIDFWCEVSGEKLEMVITNILFNEFSELLTDYADEGFVFNISINDFVHSLESRNHEGEYSPKMERSSYAKSGITINIPKDFISTTENLNNKKDELKSLEDSIEEVTKEISNEKYKEKLKSEQQQGNGQNLSGYNPETSGADNDASQKNDVQNQEDNHGQEPNDQNYEQEFEQVDAIAHDNEEDKDSNISENSKEKENNKEAHGDEKSQDMLGSIEELEEKLRKLKENKAKLQEAIDNINQDIKEGLGANIDIDVLSNSDMNMSKQEFAEMLSELKRHAQTTNRGEQLPSFIERSEVELYKIKTTWFKEVEQMVMKYAPRQKSSFQRPNKKYLHSGTYLSSKALLSKVNGIEGIRVYLDSSASMSKEDLNITISLLQKLSKLFPKETRAFEFNTVLRELKVVKGKLVEIPKSTGGTQINCVLDNMVRSEAGKYLTLIVTDGEIGEEGVEDVVNKLRESPKEKVCIICTTKCGYDCIKLINEQVPKIRCKVVCVDNEEVEIAKKYR